MVSQTAEYALRAIVHLACEPASPQTTRQIAEATRVPVGYLSKVLQSLARARLITSQRGLHGGFTLAVNPVNLSVYDVIQAVDPMQRIICCPLNLESHSSRLCPLHQRLDDALALVEQSFRQSTIADILGDPSTSLFEERAPEESPPLAAAP